MCGILGEINLQSINPHRFERQLDSIQHRGPDDAGIWENAARTVALGSRRLAIQDLSSAGKMPLHSEDARVHIVFNGEIYNFHDVRSDLKSLGHTFHSGSDAEVVLKSYLAWGEQCLENLDGMFAFAIFDERKGGSLLLARDRAGEKPLYFWPNSNGLAFASELKALLLNPALPRRLNGAALHEYLLRGYATRERCFVDGVYKLPPAHLLTCSLSDPTPQIRPYWSIPAPTPNKRPANELAEELEHLLRRSVRRQLIADVPVGVLLSGGVDSSLITALAAAESASPIRTFHIAFPGYGHYDESDYARTVARHFGTEHHELAGQDIRPDDLDKVLDYLDEPLADHSVLPTFLVSKLTRQYVKAALGGDGGDELFGGYSHYQHLLRLESAKRLIPNVFRNTLLPNVLKKIPVGIKGRNYLAQWVGNMNDGSLTDPYALGQILNQQVAKDQRIHPQKLAGEAVNTLHSATRHDFTHYLPDDILTKVDRMSMAHSLELRAPWLDRAVVEFAFSQVPEALKTTREQKKILPKILAQRLLPAGLDLQKKQGFSIPLKQWLATPEWQQYFREGLSNCQIADTQAMQRMLHREGRYSWMSNSTRLFALLVLEKWLRKYDIRLA